MNKELETRCLACGVRSVREARFCRQCGAGLRSDELGGSADLVSPDAITVELIAHQKMTAHLRPPTAPVEVADAPMDSSDLDRHLANVYRAKVIERIKHKRRMAGALLLALFAIAGLTIWALRRQPQLSVAQNPPNVSVPEPVVPTDPGSETNPEVTTISSMPITSIETGASISAVRTRRLEKQKAGPTVPAARVAPKPDPTVLYQQAVNIVQGRDVKKLKRSELLQALQYFQNVRSGPHVADANRQADRLGREFDRRTF